MELKEIEEKKKECLFAIDALMCDAEFIVKTLPILRDKLLNIKTEYEAELWDIEINEFVDCLAVIKL